VLIESSNSDSRLEFGELDGDYFRASLYSDSHAANIRVSTHTDPYGVVRLFKEAASDWRGWPGEKCWESLEGDFRIELRSGSTGHIRLRILIAHDCGNPDPWRLNAEFGIEAGQLESVALNVERFFGK
jgi:hypothetical protein